MKKAAARVQEETAKRCSCGAAFSRRDLIKLRSLTPLGMMHLDGESAKSIYCFTHTRWSCRTTFGVPVEVFADELDEPVPEKLLLGTVACQGHCTRIEDLDLCENECRLAPYRRFLLERLIPRK